MKLKSYLEKQLQKALDHQDEHPISGSANRDVKEARRALAQYNKEVQDHETTVFGYSNYDDMESMGWLNRGD
jgi:hypothetical protein